MRSPDELLFTGNDGSPQQLQDVIADGLDGGYQVRIPELEQLLTAGSPSHRLMACMLLTAWGQPSGFQSLIEWASNPDLAPWVKDPVTYDRIHGADDAYSNLADALRTSFLNDKSEELRRMQCEAASALLRIYCDCFFDRPLALALLHDTTVLSQLEPQISAAIEACLRTLRICRTHSFDLATQTASLILPLARANDEAAARYADELTRLAPDHTRMLRELASSLAGGTGDATRRCLERSMQSGKPSVIQQAEKALAARRIISCAPRRP